MVILMSTQVQPSNSNMLGYSAAPNIETSSVQAAIQVLRDLGNSEGASVQAAIQVLMDLGNSEGGLVARAKLGKAVSVILGDMIALISRSDMSMEARNGNDMKLEDHEDNKKRYC
jgi:hypothetical protein